MMMVGANGQIGDPMVWGHPATQVNLPLTHSLSALCAQQKYSILVFLFNSSFIDLSHNFDLVALFILHKS